VKENEMKILLAYDGGEPARRALDTAASIAKAMGATLDVISVVPFRTGRSPIDPWDDREVHDTELKDAKVRLADLGIFARLLEPAGEPAEEIETAAKSGGYDMVVIGSRRQGVLGRILQGSVSQHVATHTDATVVIAR
jgi:nucleotide-binding universal stress UspA family protein